MPLHISDYGLDVPDALAAAVLEHGAGRQRVMDELGLGSHRARRVIREIRGQSLEAQSAAGMPGVKRDFSVTGDTAQCTVLTSDLVRTEADMLRVAEVDLEVWEPYQMEAGAWGSPVKVAEYDGPRKVSETAKTVQLYRVSIKFRRKVFEPLLKDLVADLIGDLRLAGAVREVSPSPAAEGGHLLCLHVPDLHLDKVPVDGEWDAPAAHADAIDGLIRRASGFPVSLVLLPLGNDALNTDGGRGTTTAGTPQAGLNRWRESFRALIAMYRAAIDRALEVAPVHVVVVEGNHDEESAFHAGVVLEAFYAGVPEVTIDNSHAPRKYLEWEGTLLGLTHGNGAKLKDLPLLMATEAPEAWARATGSKEWLTGHRHIRQIETFGPVVVRITPSLAPDDDWHRKQGYVGSARQAEAYVYAPGEGRVGEFVYTIPRCR